MSEKPITIVKVDAAGTVSRINPDGSLSPVESRTDWGRLQRRTTEEIRAAALADPDFPPTEPEDWLDAWRPPDTCSGGAPGRMIPAEMQTLPTMTVEDFLRWHDTRPETEHYELVEGEVVAMAPERSEHNQVKYLVWQALRAAVRAAEAACEVYGDGMTVRIDEHTAYEPDTVMHCGDPLPHGVQIIPNPILVVEVLSPSSKGRDAGIKLADYFRLPGLVHYLIVDAARPRVVHHRRRDAAVIETRTVTEGVLALEPPGLRVDVAAFYAW